MVAASAPRQSGYRHRIGATRVGRARVVVAALLSGGDAMVLQGFG